VKAGALTAVFRLRHSYTSAPAAERSVLLVNYENQRNAFKLVDIKSPPLPATVNDAIYGSPRRWLNDSSTAPGRRVAPPPPATALVGSERCDCVYSGDLQPCGCPRFFQATSAALSPSLPDVTSELYAEEHDDVGGGGSRAEVYLSRNCGGGAGGSRPTWQASALCRGCANVDAGPLPTLTDDQQQQQQQGAAEETATCWRPEDDIPYCQTPHHRRASSTEAANEPISIAPWQVST